MRRRAGSSARRRGGRSGQLADEAARTYGGFEPYNTHIHGISAATVADAPEFHEVLPRLLAFIGSDVVCAHNARFDSAVLVAAAIAVDVEPPSLRFLCTLTAARRCLALPSYRLPFVAEALDISLADHHNAVADAGAVAVLVPLLARELEVTTLEELIAITQIAPRPTPLPTTDQPHPDASTAHPLWGRRGGLHGRPLVYDASPRARRIICAGKLPKRRSRSAPTSSSSATSIPHDLSRETPPARRRRRLSASFRRPRHRGDDRVRLPPGALIDRGRVA